MRSGHGYCDEPEFAGTARPTMGHDVVRRVGCTRRRMAGDLRQLHAKGPSAKSY